MGIRETHSAQQAHIFCLIKRLPVKGRTLNIPERHIYNQRLPRYTVQCTYTNTTFTVFLTGIGISRSFHLGVDNEISTYFIRCRH